MSPAARLDPPACMFLPSYELRRYDRPAGQQTERRSVGVLYHTPAADFLFSSAYYTRAWTKRPRSAGFASIVSLDQY